MSEIFRSQYVFSQWFAKTIYNHSIRNENNTAALRYSNAHINSPRDLQSWMRGLWVVVIYLLCLRRWLPAHGFWRMPLTINCAALLTVWTCRYLLPLCSNIYTLKLSMWKAIWWLSQARWWFLFNLCIWNNSFWRKMRGSTQLRIRRYNLYQMQDGIYFIKWSMCRQYWKLLNQIRQWDMPNMQR